MFVANDPAQLKLDLIWFPAASPDGTDMRPSDAAFRDFRRLLVTAVAVFNGQRPLFDLLDQTTDHLYGRLRSQLDRSPRPGALAVVRTMHAQQPRPKVIEGCGLVERGQRAEAIAGRLVFQHGRWIADALSFGQARLTRWTHRTPA